MVKVTVKTLDSKVHVFDVSGEMTVKEFKHHIAPSVHLHQDVQKFILKGRVLQDDKKLADYDLGDSTLHLLQKATDSAVPVPGTSANTSQPSSSSLANQPSSGAPAPRTSRTLTDHVDNIDLDEEEVSLSDVLKHCPEEWIGTIQLDMRRQLGMPPQIPFSDGFVKLFTKSSTS